MAIPFSDIYTKAIALFDDPKITKAYETNPIQFEKLMYTYLQNAIAMFTNPASVGMRLANYTEPEGLMQTIDADGTHQTFKIEFELRDGSIYTYIEDGQIVQGEIEQVGDDYYAKFPNILPVGKQYALEQYYCGEFLDSFQNLNSKTTAGDKLIVGEIKDILARLLVKAWGEEERNLLLDIRNLMQDSDFKITGNDRILKAKNDWINQLDSEILQLENKLSWNLRFMYGSQTIGRG